MALDTVMTADALPERNKKRNVAGYKDAFKKRFGPGATSAATRNGPKKDDEKKDDKKSPPKRKKGKKDDKKKSTAKKKAMLAKPAAVSAGAPTKTVSLSGQASPFLLQ